MTLELTATLALIASHAIVIGISFYAGLRHGKEVGYLEAEAELAAIASEEAENRKRSSPFTVAEPEEGEWIPWDKSECPVEAMTKVDVKFRDGEEINGRWAQNWVWGHPNPLNDPNDITHYRLSK